MALNRYSMEQIIQGSRGDEVLMLKKTLNEIGYQLELSDEFCSATTEAVVAFQRSVSIYPDGIVGDVTWAFLVNVQGLKARTAQ